MWRAKFYKQEDEFKELQKNFSELLTTHNELTTKYENLEKEYDQFQLEVQKHMDSCNNNSSSSNAKLPIIIETSELGKLYFQSRMDNSETIKIDFNEDGTIKVNEKT